MDASDEIQSITNEVLHSIRVNSRTIPQLTPVTSLADTDYFEIAGGKRVAYSMVRDLIMALVEAELDTVKTLIHKNELKSIQFSVTDSTASLSVSSNGKTVTTSVPIATDERTGFMTAADKAMLTLHDKEIGVLQSKVADIIVEKDEGGRPKPFIVFRGSFDPKASYYAGDTLNTLSFAYEISAVEYFGCVWVCAKTGTHNPPSWLTKDWIFYLGDPTFKVRLTGGPLAVNPRKFNFTLTVEAEKGGQDVTQHILPQDIVWTRYTTDQDGNQRVLSDNVWNAKHSATYLTLPLTEEDIDPELGVPVVCRFTATVTLRDGSETSAVYGI